MSTARRLHWSYQEYVLLRDRSDTKHEYCDGEIFSMAGGTPAHAALAVAVGSELRKVLHGTCHVFSSDLCIRVEATDLSTCPDLSIVCGPHQVSGIDANAVTNPTLLVEVTSPSTEDYDRGNKLSHYKQLPSLQAVLFVSHKHRSITVVSRALGGWAERVFLSGERVVLESPSCAFAVDDVYAGITPDPRS